MNKSCFFCVCDFRTHIFPTPQLQPTLYCSTWWEFLVKGMWLGHSTNLCLLIHVFKLFIFNIIAYTWRLRFAFLFFVLCLLSLVFSPQPSCWTVFRILLWFTYSSLGCISARLWISGIPPRPVCTKSCSPKQLYWERAGSLRGGTWEEVFQLVGCALEGNRGTLALSPPCFCFLAMIGVAFLHHTPPPWCAALPQAQGSRDRDLPTWARPPPCHPQVSVTVMGSWPAQLSVWL